jgi:nitrate reductase NapE component
MSFFAMYALCVLITCFYVTIDMRQKEEDYLQHRATDKLFAILVLSLFWPVLFVTTVAGFIIGFIKSLIGGIK